MGYNIFRPYDLYLFNFILSRWKNASKTAFFPFGHTFHCSKDTHKIYTCKHFFTFFSYLWIIFIKISVLAYKTWGWGDEINFDSKIQKFKDSKFKILKGNEGWNFSVIGLLCWVLWVCCRWKIVYVAKVRKKMKPDDFFWFFFCCWDGCPAAFAMPP